MKATRLTCEFRPNPSGIDERQPRLGWTVESDRRNAKQTAYRVLVASSLERLAGDRGDLWDSGRTPREQTAQVRYGGKSLQSHSRCFWKVMLWDNDGKQGPWSEEGAWSMGILEPSEWKAQWIGYDAPRRGEQAPPFAGASRWIWHDVQRPWDIPAGKRYFVRTVGIQKPVATSDLAVTGDDKFTLFINGKEAASTKPGPDSWQHPQRLNVTSLLRTGKNVLYAEVSNDSPGPAGFLFWLRLTDDDGKVETTVSDRSWRTSDTPIDHWKADGPRTDEGMTASVVGDIGSPPWGPLDGSMLILPPPRELETTVTLNKPVKRAVLYASALGLCDVYLNAERVSDDFFTPGWTDYTKRVYYRAYDVTSLLKQGHNRWSASLADGWFSGYLGWGLKRDHYGAKTRFLGQLHIEYKDGTVDDIGTGPHWRASTGPTLEADFLMGETHDARLAAKSSSAMATGEPVDVGTDLRILIEAHPGPPVRRLEEITPVSISPSGPDRWIVDLGQNFAGVVRLRVQGSSGQMITLRFAERLNPDGSFYTTNLRSARATDTYICSGAGEELWEPRFTFHGFQYVEVRGLTKPPTRETITGIPLTSDTPLAGSFECSDSLVNTLHQNILRTQRANFIDVPTDCPQRDERLGWTGDAQAYIRSACMNTDVQAFFHKWIVDLTDAQRADGQFPMVAPLKVAGGDGGPAWADAGVICPWTIYEVYGDRDILERHFEAMAKFVDFCRERSTPQLLPPVDFHCFGDWLNIDAETPKEIIYTSYFAHAADVVSRAADALGKNEEAVRYRKLFEEVRRAFVRAYVDNDGHVKGRTQTGYVLALAFGLLDGDTRTQAGNHLIEDIRSRDWHLSTGFVGTKDLMLVLADLGRNDVAYRLLQNETFPSWGFTIRNGATSIWERWDGWTPEKGFQDAGMNSFAHYAFGAVYQWMVENIGGIRCEAPGFRKFTIAPQPGGTLTWAKVKYRSIAGEIACSWQAGSGEMRVTVDIPANTTATIRLPGVAGQVTESGSPVRGVDGLRLLADGSLEAGSGHYEFRYPSTK